MNDKQRNRIEERLKEERREAIEAIDHFEDRPKGEAGEEDGGLTNYPLHMADEGTDAMEREKEFLLASQEGRHLYAIDRALRRLYKEPERFGVCTECGKEIAFERLELLPHAEHCVECEREAESRAEGATS